jgi:glycosyltransferase 2 family protein
MILFNRISGLVPPLKALVTVAALWLVVRNYDVSRVLAAVAHANGGRLTLVAAITAIQLAVQVWRWQLVHRCLTAVRAPFWTLFLGFGRGLLYGQLFPSTLGTDAIRVATIAPSAGVQMAARSVICDRFLGLLGLLAIVAATLPLFAVFVDAGLPLLTLAGVTFGSLGAAAAFLLWPRLLELVPYVGRFGAAAMRDLGAVIAPGRSGFAIGGLTLLTHLSSVGLFAAIAWALDVRISLLASLLVIPPTLLIISVPVSLGGWGVREAAVASGLVMMHADPVGGIAVSVLYGLVSPLSGAAIELAALLARTGARLAHLARDPQSG